MSFFQRTQHVACQSPLLAVQERQTYVFMNNLLGDGPERVFSFHLGHRPDCLRTGNVSLHRGQFKVCPRQKMLADSLNCAKASSTGRVSQHERNGDWVPMPLQRGLS